MENNIVLSAKGICMTFPGVKALENVDFNLRKGEIRALMGENGAGKSTLIKCLTGVNKFEAGEIHLRSGCEQGHVRCATQRNFHGLSGSKPVSESFCGGESVYRQRADDKVPYGEQKENERDGCKADEGFGFGR